MSVSQAKRDKLHLLHIRDAAEKVGKFVVGLDYKKFAEGDKDHDAILMQIIVVGEEANGLSDELKEKYHKLPWDKARSVRNHIAHGYFNVDKKIVWEIAIGDLPLLKHEVEKILKEM